MVDLAAECRERATYLKAMEPEGLSTIERQCMETLFKAEAALATLAAHHQTARADALREAAEVALDAKSPRGTPDESDPWERGYAAGFMWTQDAIYEAILALPQASRKEQTDAD